MARTLKYTLKCLPGTANYRIRVSVLRLTRQTGWYRWIGRSQRTDIAKEPRLKLLNRYAAQRMTPGSDTRFDEILLKALAILVIPINDYNDAQLRPVRLHTSIAAKTRLKLPEKVGLSLVWVNAKRVAWDDLRDQDVERLCH